MCWLHLSASRCVGHTPLKSSLSSISSSCTPGRQISFTHHHPCILFLTSLPPLSSSYSCASCSLPICFLHPHIPSESSLFLRLLCWSLVHSQCSFHDCFGSPALSWCMSLCWDSVTSLCLWPTTSSLEQSYFTAAQWPFVVWSCSLVKHRGSQSKCWGCIHAPRNNIHNSERERERKNNYR